MKDIYGFKESSDDIYVIKCCYDQGTLSMNQKIVKGMDRDFDILIENKPVEATSLKEAYIKVHTTTCIVVESYCFKEDIYTSVFNVRKKMAEMLDARISSVGETLTKLRTAKEMIGTLESEIEEA